MYIFVILCSLIISVYYGLVIGFMKVIPNTSSTVTTTYKSYYFAIFFLILQNISMVYIFLSYLGSGNIIAIKLYSWVNSGYLSISFGLLFDSLTNVMLVVVILISTIVHFFSFEYMAKDPHISRFISYLSLFTFFMLILITADNFLQLFFGWEGVGLCSYLLINFWYTRIQANKSALKALIVNRIGDFGLMFAIALIASNFKSVDYAIVFSLVPYFSKQTVVFFDCSFNLITLIAFFLFFSAIGKSAQIGLHVWLPDAMEGPTPVSALIHAATMVTAGVFLVIRSSVIFEYAPSILNFMTFMGALTAFFAATTAFFQNDIKKIIAYSTCSQLGYMFMACGTSNYIVSLYHLTNHAFFKALLFLCAGAIIHSMSNEQDLRKFGNLRLLMPLVYICFLIGSLSLMGFPYLSGFYSKDFLLEVLYLKGTNFSTFAYILGIMSAFLTTLYSYKLIYLVFFNDVNFSKTTLRDFHPPGKFVYFCLIFLSFASIFSGFLLKDIFIGFGSDFFSDSIFILPNNYISFEVEFIPFIIKFLPFFLSIIALLIFYVLYIYNHDIFFTYFTENNIVKSVNTFFFKKWYFDKLYNVFNLYILKKSYTIFIEIIDKGILEILGPDGLVKSIKAITYTIKNGYTTKLYNVFCFNLFFINCIFFYYEFFI